MEGKGLSWGAILLGVLAAGSLVALLPHQARAAEAPPAAGYDSRICCKDQLARTCLFAFCVNATIISTRCADLACHCKILSPGSKCPPGYPNSDLLAHKGSMVALLPEAQAETAVAVAGGGGSKTCCRDEDARKCFFVCLFKGSRTVCAATCHCVLTTAETCPGHYPSSNLLTTKEDLANGYCKLGCRSSVCDTLIKADDGSDDMKVAVERCGDACGRLCDRRAGADAGGIASVAA